MDSIAPAAAPEPPGGIVLLTQPQVAKLLQIDVREVRRLVSARQFPQPIRLSPKRPRWLLDDIKRWLEKKARKSAEPRDGTPEDTMKSLLDTILAQPVAAEVRPAADLATLARLGKELLDAEEGHAAASSDCARQAGEIFKRAWEQLAPQHRWHAWLKENKLPRERVNERIRIYDGWGSIPAETASRGVSACLEFLRTGEVKDEAAASGHRGVAGQEGADDEEVT